METPPNNTPESSPERARRIARLNDILRTTFHPTFGRVLMTSGVQALGDERISEIVEAVQRFDTFTSDNDPYGEHDFGKIVLGDGTAVFWKIDCYDRAMTFGSPDPADPNVTQRILTIMLCDEY